MSAASAHWPEVTLGEVCEFKYGKSLPEANRVAGQVPVFGSNGPVGLHDEAITAGTTIIIGRKGSFGEVNFSPTPCWPIDTTYYVDSTATKADLRWLAYRLSELGLTGLNRAAAVPGLNREDAYRQRLLLPPLLEQQRIAEILDKTEALRAKRRAALAQLGTFTQSIFLDMFGDHRTLLERWATRKLGELLDFLTSGSRGWAEHYSEKGDLFLRIQNVRRDELSLDDIAFVSAPETAEAKRTRVKPGDVLLSITADLGRTAVFPEGLGPAFINQHLSILRTKALVPRFLSAYLASSVGQRQVSGRNRHAVKAGLNFDDIRSFIVPVPPMHLQHDFAHRVAAVEKLKATHRASLAELDALFASLQHRAFRGEL